jgi:hypothetical protein
MIRQLLHVALLCAGVMPAQAASVGATHCERFNSALPDHGSATQFLWTTQPEAVPATPAFKIGVWGDSLTSAPNFIDAALDASGIPRNAVYPSFIQAGMKVTGLSLAVRASCASAGWKTAYAHKEKHSATGFSQGFLSMHSDTPGDTVFLDFRAPVASSRVQALTMLYDKPKPDSSLLLAISIDGGPEKLVSLSRLASTTLAIKPDAPMATFQLRLVSGEITLHGFAPRYAETPAVILDTMSVPGAQLHSWSNAADRLFNAPASSDYDLILVEYGTNEGASPAFNSDQYRSYLRTNLGRLRQFYPRARCVLIGPPDRGTLATAGPPMKFANVHLQITQAQQQIGAEFRCSFWNWQLAMGGPGAAVRWLHMTPPQMQPDLTHLTATGYAASGRMFGTSFPLNKHSP